MPTPSTPCYCTMTLVLGGLALVNLGLIGVLVVIGLRSLALGKDVVWECSWQFPVRTAQRLARLCRWRPHIPNTNPLAGLRPQGFGREGWGAPARWRLLAGNAAGPRAIRQDRGNEPATRRPVRAQHYLTIGERMRLQTEPRRWAT